MCEALLEKGIGLEKGIKLLLRHLIPCFEAVDGDTLLVDLVSKMEDGHVGCINLVMCLMKCLSVFSGCGLNRF